MEHLLEYEDFMNESTKYGKNHLEDQGASLGKIVTKIKDLKKGGEYCIVDFGLDEWNSGYKYEGIKDGKHYFKDVLSPFNDNPLEFTEEELQEFIDDKAVAQVM